MSMAPDAAKVGHIGYMLTPMVNNMSGLAMWGPPQVIARSKLIQGGSDVLPKLYTCSCVCVSVCVYLHVCLCVCLCVFLCVVVLLRCQLIFEKFWASVRRVSASHLDRCFVSVRRLAGPLARYIRVFCKNRFGRVDRTDHGKPTSHPTGGCRTRGCSAVAIERQCWPQSPTSGSFF